jgi:hypothetical protein
MLIYAFNDGGFGNAVFSQYAAILLAILFNGELVNITEKHKIKSFEQTFNCIDDAKFMDIVNEKINNNNTIIDINQNYFLVGYYQHDHYYVKYKKEIIEFIERHPDNIIFAAHYAKPYKFINIIEPVKTIIYDIVIHIRLGDFVGLGWTMDPNSLISVIKTLNIKKNQLVSIVIKEPSNELEEKYIAYIQNTIPNAVLEINENPIIDYNIMRNAKTLLCSCSTLSWIASFMGCENQIVYFPNYQSRWNHELYRKPHDRMIYYDFNRSYQIDLWNILGHVDYKIKLLVMNMNMMHHKNLNALQKYKKIEITSIIDVNDITKMDISSFDAVYSPCGPILVKDFPNTLFLFGPHFSVFPNKKDMEMIEGQKSIYLQPSKWAMESWKNNKEYCENIRFDILPWGVDTDVFQCRKKRNKVFIYFKRRIPSEFYLVENELKKRSIAYRIFDYVNRYSEEEYKDFLKECKYGIWVDAHESQGFALEEALACDVPLLVWNVSNMKQEYGSSYSEIPATTIPYWDERCGEYFYKAEDFIETLDLFIEKEESQKYKPREYIMENLSISVCERRMVNLIKKYKK